MAKTAYKGKYTSLPVQDRLITNGIELRDNPATIENAVYQHSGLCQTFLPYRKQDDKVTIWDRQQGRVNLSIQCLQVRDPRTGKHCTLGLPHGTRARLILAYLNTQAIRTQSAEIDVEESMTAFVRNLGITPNGRHINDIKNQLARLAASIMTISYDVSNEQTINAPFGVVSKFDLWFPKDDRQRVLWTSHVNLNQAYFENLLAHAVPLDDRALAALSHNAMAMDIYSWLGQRLHSIKGVQFVPWAGLQAQFGHGYARMADFKRAFRKTLKMVRLVYPDSRLEEVPNKGFNLLNSRPPIPYNIARSLMLGTKAGK